MATVEQFETAFGELRDATTKVANRIDKLLEQLNSGGLSEDEENKVLADLQSATDALRAMGEDVENPNPNPLPDDGDVPL